MTVGELRRALRGIPDETVIEGFNSREQSHSYYDLDSVVFDAAGAILVEFVRKL
jgi:hypothetical protein